MNVAQRNRAATIARRQCSATQWRATWLRREHARVGGKCHFCKGHTELEGDGPFRATVDHLIPRALKGADHPKNWRLACFTCNNLKDDRSEAEFIAELRAVGIRD